MGPVRASAPDCCWWLREGALEFAVSAWMPAASPTHVELVDRELRAVACCGPRAACRSCTRAELVELLTALDAVAELPGRVNLPVVACLDSRAALLLL